MMKLRPLLLGLMLSYSLISAQAIVFAQDPVAPKKKEVPFSASMDRAANAQGWSKIYYASFKRSAEVSYLKLAGSNCAQSIRILYSVQNQFASTTKFHHIARKRRRVACSYYNLLQEVGRRSGFPRELPNLGSGHCERL
ncbi:MAG: hypothetical protein QNL04_15420 [SAR324 cluster bacterium]|nr:hypothetical protein [SAR324 cluster bacterium]